MAAVTGQEAEELLLVGAPMYVGRRHGGRVTIYRWAQVSPSRGRLGPFPSYPANFLCCSLQRWGPFPDPWVLPEPSSGGQRGSWGVPYPHTCVHSVRGGGAWWVPKGTPAQTPGSLLQPMVG